MVMSTKKERNGFDTLVNVIHQQNGWRASIMWWFCRLKFCFQDWKYADKRHKWKEKVQKNASVSFLWTNDIVLSTLFSTRRIGALGWFWTNNAARFLKTLEVHSVLYDQRKVRFLKEIFVFIKVSWKTTKCAFEIVFSPCARPIYLAWTQRFFLRELFFWINLWVFE